MSVHAFRVELADVDRGVYETLDLDVARHPSESVGYLVTRVLARALEHAEGIAFSKGGLSDPDEPALTIRDLTGRLVAWIEVGTPSAERLHRASKACERVVVYCHKDVGVYLRSLAGQRVHAPERVTVVAMDRALVEGLGARLERRNHLTLSVTEGELYADLGGASFTATLARHPFPA